MIKEPRGRLPETDDEACEDFRAYFPPDMAERHIRAYQQLRAVGFPPDDAALRTMTDVLDRERKRLAGLLGHN